MRMILLVLAFIFVGCGEGDGTDVYVNQIIDDHAVSAPADVEQADEDPVVEEVEI